MKKIILGCLIVFAVLRSHAQCVSSFSFYPDTTGLTFFFNDSSTANGSPDSVDLWIWSYGDGTTDTISVPYTTAIHPYALPGQYQVCLEIVDFDSIPCSDTFCTMVSVQCTPECIWPGDANHDLVANNIDLLAIGVGYGFSGAPRNDTSIDWSPKLTQNWTNWLASNINYKHIDCNGDGIIDANDTVAIIQNYGLTHTKTLSNNDNTSANPPLYLEFANNADTVVAGSTVKVKVKLGDLATPVNNAYGLAFTVNYDNTQIKNSVSFNFANSWLGSASQLVSLARNNFSNGAADVAVCRINHADTSGSGQVGEMEIVMEDIIVGKVSLTVSNVKVISANEADIAVNVFGDSAIVIPAGIDDLQELNSKIEVYPNPSGSMLNIDLKKFEPEAITVTNLLGQPMQVGWKKSNSNIQRLNVRNLSEGVYFVHIKTKAVAVVKKISIIR